MQSFVHFYLAVPQQGLKSLWYHNETIQLTDNDYNAKWNDFLIEF